MNYTLYGKMEFSSQNRQYVRVIERVRTMNEGWSFDVVSPNYVYMENRGEQQQWKKLPPKNDRRRQQ